MGSLDDFRGLMARFAQVMGVEVPEVDDQGRCGLSADDGSSLYFMCSPATGFVAVMVTAGAMPPGGNASTLQALLRENLELWVNTGATLALDEQGRVLCMAGSPLDGLDGERLAVIADGLVQVTERVAGRLRDGEFRAVAAAADDLRFDPTEFMIRG